MKIDPLAENVENNLVEMIKWTLGGELSPPNLYVVLVIIDELVRAYLEDGRATADSWDRVKEQALRREARAWVRDRIATAKRSAAGDM